MWIDLLGIFNKIMKGEFVKKYIILLVLCLFIFGCEDHSNATDKVSQQEIVCDNGLSDWLESDSHFGQCVAKSVRIVRLSKKEYQPQFKDCKDEKTEWTPLFEGDKIFDDLGLAQRKIRRGFEVRKEICDAFQNLNSDDKKD